MSPSFHSLFFYCHPQARPFSPIPNVMPPLALSSAKGLGIFMFRYPRACPFSLISNAPFSIALKALKNEERLVIYLILDHR